jgi:hypothetical protein
MSPQNALAILAVVGLILTGRVDFGAASSTVAKTTCKAAPVHHTPYPGGDDRLARLPWVRGEPRATGLVGLLWYWPDAWRQRRLRLARIFTDGVAPAGYATKILWVFVGKRARGIGGAQLVVRGRRLDDEGSFTQTFRAVSYSGQKGAPSYASVVDVPAAGCWKLSLSTGTLRASVVFQAVRGAEPPTLCTAEEVESLVRRFVAAFNDGDAEELNAIFAREPDFEWYSTGAPGERLDPIARDRSSLVQYFRDRHALGERLTLRSITFNGNTTGSRTYGNFVYELERGAADLAPTPYRGKGAALCYRTRSDAIFVWSMAPVVG